MESSLVVDGDVHGGEAVDARRVLLPPVLRELREAAGAELLLAPVDRLRASSFVGHEGHAVATCRRDARDVHHDHRATRLGYAGVFEGPLREESVEARVACHHHRAATVEAQDLRRALERAEHDHDASVFAQVRERLGAAPEHVEVRDGLGPGHAQRPDRALRRQVHVTAGGERRGPDEEERLLRDPCAEVLVDDLVDLSHRRSLAPEPRLGAAQKKLWSVRITRSGSKPNVSSDP